MNKMVTENTENIFRSWKSPTYEEERALPS